MSWFDHYLALKLPPIVADSLSQRFNTLNSLQSQKIAGHVQMLLGKKLMSQCGVLVLCMHKLIHLSASNMQKVDCSLENLIIV